MHFTSSRFEFGASFLTQLVDYFPSEVIWKIDMVKVALVVHASLILTSPIPKVCFLRYKKMIVLRHLVYILELLISDVNFFYII